MTRLVVTGTRENHPFVWTYLDYICKQVIKSEIELVILGDAKGVDAKAEEWCIANNQAHKIFIADWETFGKGAGPIRNSAMIMHARPGDWCLALPSSKSIGTWDCVMKATNAGLATLVLPWDETP